MQRMLQLMSKWCDERAQKQSLEAENFRSFYIRVHSLISKQVPLFSMSTQYTIHFSHWPSVSLRVQFLAFRVKFHKTVGNTSVLSMVGNIDSMCGDTLKLLFKYRGKIYLKASQGETFIEYWAKNIRNKSTLAFRWRWFSWIGSAEDWHIFCTPAIQARGGKQ